MERNNYRVTLSKTGQFEVNGAVHGKGNYRMNSCDMLYIFIPAGIQCLTRFIGMRIVDGTGTVSLLRGECDMLGNHHCIFTPKCTGSHSFTAIWGAEELYDSLNINSEAVTARNDTRTSADGKSCSLFRSHSLIQNAMSNKNDEAILLKAKHTDLSNTVIVNPTFNIKEQQLEIRALSIQTVLCFSLGKLKNWSSVLKISSKLNYNMIHFTPFQLLGESSSCFSIADQNDIDDHYFDNKTMKNEKYRLLKEEMVKIKKLGLLTCTDLVLNHTASNSEWLHKNPDAGYNLENSPHLKAALELDIAIQDFSRNLAMNKYEKHHPYNISRYINNEDDVKRLSDCFNKECLQPLKLYEYFQINFNKCRDQFSKVKSASYQRTQSQLNKEYIENFDHGFRYAQLLQHCKEQIGANRNDSIVVNGMLSATCCKNEDELMKCLHSVQNELYNLHKSTENDILNAFRGTVQYERIECKKGPIGTKHYEALLPRYFVGITDDKSGAICYLAVNGWVMDWDASVDFAAPGTLVYLGRRLVAWSDCVKLRYGENENENKELWKHMTKYVEKIADTFDGIRLDNCHSTPIRVAKYLLQKARSINRNLFVFAELFTGDEKIDFKFEEQLGINLLVREAMNSYNSESLSNYLNYYGGSNLYKLSNYDTWNLMTANKSDKFITSEYEDDYKNFVNTIPLCKSICPAIIYDCSHDNPTPSQNQTSQNCIGLAAAISASISSIGSTRGFDEIVNENPSVVAQEKLYIDYSVACNDVTTDVSSDCENGNKKKQYVEEKKNETLVINDADKKKEPTNIEISIRNNGYNTVYIRGSWDNWKDNIVLERKDKCFAVALDFNKYRIEKKRKYFYKYIIDGNNWICNELEPKETDAHNNMNNYFENNSELIENTNYHLVNGNNLGWAESKELPGIMQIRIILNDIHTYMSVNKFDHMESKCLTHDLIQITRYNACTNSQFVFLIRMSYSYSDIDNSNYKIQNIYINGKFKKIHLNAKLHCSRGAADALNRMKRENKCNSCLVNAQMNCKKCEVLQNYHIGIDCNLSYSENNLAPNRIVYRPEQRDSELTLQNFSPGSILVLEMGLNSEIKAEIDSKLSTMNGYIKHMTSSNISYLLFSCDNEEKARTNGHRGTYGLNNTGKFRYAGIYGCLYYLDRNRVYGDKENCNEIINNLREGDWLFQYTLDRLNDRKEYSALRGVLHDIFNLYKGNIPNAMKPIWFDYIVRNVFRKLCNVIMEKIPHNLKIACKYDVFVQQLIVSAYQFYSYVPSSPLIWETEMSSLCAGLPHFSTGFMRNWGRDTFISLNGILLCTGRFNEAEEEILGYARTLYNGLIPNLLDSGNNPRYNARDATFFFLEAIQNYCLTAPNGIGILKKSVKNIFENCTYSVGEVVFSILNCHYSGIKFRERNAGSALDEHMADNGFNVQIRLDENNTGLLLGGNNDNCGTWMDKMGSSAKAGNKGKPATTRNGSPIEILGLLKSALRFFSSLPDEIFETKVLYNAKNEKLFLNKWNNLIKARFETCYYIPEKASMDSEYYISDPSKVQHRSVYKDCYKCEKSFSDYQLRPNISVAMAVAPELFNIKHALKCIEIIENVLYSTTQLGLKTLCPDDSEYRPDYDNGNDSNDMSVAHGFNYHQGPEWVWPLGYFLTAKYIFLTAAEENDLNEVINIPETQALQNKYPSDMLPETTANSTKVKSNNGGEVNIRDYYSIAKLPLQHSPSLKTISACMNCLLQHRDYIYNDPWLSLPEVTNADGKFCHHGCPAQAWSIGTILEFISMISQNSN